MKHINTKFFIMFLAGILFSAITVFAATITVNTDFTGDAVQYLQSLVLTDASGNTTGIVLNGDGSSYIMGNVGIGTDNPSEILDVNGTGKINNLIIGNTNSANIYMSGSELVIED